jgi:outer membrane biosynthesis protein TonB
MNDRRAYFWMGTSIMALVVVAVAILLISSAAAAQGAAVALLGVACVIAVSGVFYAVGRSEDAERAAQQPPPPPPEEKPAPHDHERPAIERRRPRPPRRPT